jgi:hypothetical protein
MYPPPHTGRDRQEEIKRLTVGPENSVCVLMLRRADRQLTVHLGNPPPPISLTLSRYRALSGVDPFLVSLGCKPANFPPSSFHKVRTHTHTHTHSRTHTNTHLTVRKAADM